jgi:hypothetical protein
VALDHDVVQDVRGIVAVGKISDLVDDQHVRLDAYSGRRDQSFRGDVINDCACS